jgi:hypothetical protein
MPQMPPATEFAVAGFRRYPPTPTATGLLHAMPGTAALDPTRRSRRRWRDTGQGADASP